MVGSPPLIAPSLLSADFSRLGEELSALKAAGADWVHLDVMDGRFVPNLTFGPPVISALRPLSPLFFDVHLMIEQPDGLLEAFAKAGADAIVIHQEATLHLDRSLQIIRALGKKAGVALNPATPPEALAYVLDHLDLILVMTVNPGFGGQKFLPSGVEKLRILRDMIGQRPIKLEVDGGIDDQTGPLVLKAGADVLVAGSFVFQDKNPKMYQKRIETLRHLPFT